MPNVENQTKQNKTKQQQQNKKKLVLLDIGY